MRSTKSDRGGVYRMVPAFEDASGEKLPPPYQLHTDESTKFLDPGQDEN
jgi:hypothetical protein